MNFKRNKLYFNSFDFAVKFWGALFLLAPISFILYINEGDFSSASLLVKEGGAAFILYLLLIYFAKKMLPNDREYDEAVASLYNGIDVRALAVLGLSRNEVNEIEPIIGGTYLPDESGRLKEKLGKDGIYRAHWYRNTCMFFSKDTMYFYHRDFCLTNGREQEYTGSYNYIDIISVNTTRKNINFVNTSDKACTAQVDVLSLMVATGNIEFVFDNMEGIQGSIRNLRQLISTSKSM